MTGEGEFIALMREMATHPAARGLMDDAAVLDVGGTRLVLTHDMMVEGVHYRRDDPADTVAWKLVAVNMSDLAAKGAAPLGVLLGFALSKDTQWERDFAVGLESALAHFDAPLLGGDTVGMPQDAARVLGLTAIGAAPPCGAPSRAGANSGDLLFVSGTIGDSGAGLSVLDRAEPASGAAAQTLIAAYHRPNPDLPLGQALAPLVTAMADISDGLLIDANRIAHASGCAIQVELDRVPLSSAFLAARGNDVDSRMFAATCGDDYQLLFAVDPGREGEIAGLAASSRRVLTKVGRCEAGRGLRVVHEGRPVPLPERLGYEHRAFIT